MMCCSQGFKPWQCRSCLREVVSAGLRRGFSTFTLDSLFSCFRFPEATVCRQPPRCDALACLMAEVPGRPAGAWRSPVGSWVSVKPPRCGKRCLPTSLLCSDTAVAVTNLVTWAAFTIPFLCILSGSPGSVYVGRRSAE